MSALRIALAHTTGIQTIYILVDEFGQAAGTILKTADVLSIKDAEGESIGPMTISAWPYRDALEDWQAKVEDAQWGPEPGHVEDNLNP